MIPDIGLEECIGMVSQWFDNAMRMHEATGNFQYIITAHEYKEIVRHLKAYKELKERNERTD